MFVLNIARTHEELVNHVEILNFEEIAKILQSYPHPHFYHLVRLLIALASNRPLTPALNYEENMNARQETHAQQERNCLSYPIAVFR